MTIIHTLRAVLVALDTFEAALADLDWDGMDAARSEQDIHALRRRLTARLAAAERDVATVITPLVGWTERGAAALTDA